MISCTIVTPQKKHLENKLLGIYIETDSGKLGILKDHLPIITKLKKDSIIYFKKDIGVIKYSIGENGFLTFQNNTGVITANDYSKIEEY